MISTCTNLDKHVLYVKGVIHVERPEPFIDTCRNCGVRQFLTNNIKAAHVQIIKERERHSSLKNRTLKTCHMSIRQIHTLVSYRQVVCTLR